MDAGSLRRLTEMVCLPCRVRHRRVPAGTVPVGIAANVAAEPGRCPATPGLAGALAPISPRGSPHSCARVASATDRRLSGTLLRSQAASQVPRSADHPFYTRADGFVLWCGRYGANALTGAEVWIRAGPVTIARRPVVSMCLIRVSLWRTLQPLLRPASAFI